jgi:hypothetical protein
MAARQRAHVEAVSAEPPAEPQPRTDGEVIRELVRMGFDAKQINKAAELRFMTLFSIREFAAKDAELGRYCRTVDRVQAEVPDRLVKYATKLAAAVS